MEYLELPDKSYLELPDGLSEQAKTDYAKKAMGQFKASVAAEHPVGAQTNAAETLFNENRPVSKGLEAASESAGKGILGKAGAIGAGVGEAAGTTAQNFLANLLQKTVGYNPSGITGDIAAAGGALANAGGNLVGDTATGKLISKIPEAVNAVKNLPSAVTALTKEGKIGKAAEIMGQPATSAGRVLNPVSSDVTAMYNLADKQAPLHASSLTQPIFDAYTKEQSMGNPSAIVSKALEGLYNKFGNATNVAYADVLEEVQRLRKTARGLMARQPQAAATLNDASEGLMTALDSASPVARQAGTLARKDMFAQDVLETLRGTNPGSKIRTMFEQQPKMAQSFGLNSEADLNNFYKLADKIGSSKLTPANLLKAGAAAGGGVLAYAFRRKIADAVFGHE